MRAVVMVEGPNSLTGTEVVARVEFATLEAFEAGFCERLSPAALFLARQDILSPAQDLSIGVRVRVIVLLPAGTRALALAGTVAWSFPRDRSPPGREPGTGILIDRVDPGDVDRVARMQRLSGAGTRVHVPGARIDAQPFRLGPSARDDEARASELPPAPVPRLMGLLVDQSFDPTPTPHTTPFPFDSRPPAAVPIEASRDAPPPPVGTPETHPGAFERRATDVNMMPAADGGDLAAPADRISDTRAEDVALASGLASVPSTGPGAGTDDRVPLSEIPSAEAELLESLDSGAEHAVSDVAGFMDGATTATVDIFADPGVELEAPGAQLAAPTQREIDARPRGSPPLVTDPPGNEPVTAELEAHPAPSQDWDAQTEHGQPAYGGSTTEATTSEGDRPPTTGNWTPPRPVPQLAPWPAPPPLPTEPLGVAFMVSGRRGADTVIALEVMRWPATGTKRIGALDEMRARGSDAFDEALSANPWMSRDASADGFGSFGDAVPLTYDDDVSGFASLSSAVARPAAEGFEHGETDPALTARIVERAVAGAAQDLADAQELQDVVGDHEPAVGAAAGPAGGVTSADDDGDSVFADGAAVPVRPAMPAARAATRPAMRPPRPGFVDDDPDTEVDLGRPIRPINGRR